MLTQRYLGGEEQIGGRCLRYYAQRKVIIVQIMFVRFFEGGGMQIWGTPQPPWLLQSVVTGCLLRRIT